MIPTAMSQIVEQVVRVATIFLLAAVLVRQSLELGAAGAAFGTVTGAVAALTLLIILYYRQRRKIHPLETMGNNSLSPTRKVMSEIIALALPITIGSVVLPLVNMVDATLILPRLQAGGFSEAQALEMFGNFTGAAMPLINMPTIFTLALATSLVPAIANANAHRNRNLIRKLSSLATRIGLMIGLPAAAGLYLLAEPISLMLYDNVDVARPLALASFAIIFISLNQTTAPVLQGMGKTYLPVTHMFTGLVFKVLINYYLTAIPAINILGPVAGTIIGFAVAGYLNLRAISRLIGAGATVINSFVKPTMNAILMGIAVYFAYPFIFALSGNIIVSERLAISVAVVATMGLGVVVYGISTLLTGTITRAELELVPKIGYKIAKILARFGLLRG